MTFFLLAGIALTVCTSVFAWSKGSQVSEKTYHVARGISFIALGVFICSVVGLFGG